MVTINSKIKINQAFFGMLDKAEQTALVQTAEILKTEVQQAEVMPRDEGTLQNNSTFVDDSDVANGKVRLVSTTPYARRLYYHPEYNFDQTKNRKAGGKWLDNWLDGDFVNKAFVARFMEVTK